MENHLSILKQEMADKGISAYRLSKLSGVSASTIGRILKEEVEPNATTIEVLLSHLIPESTFRQRGEGDGSRVSNEYSLDGNDGIYLSGVSFWDVDFINSKISIDEATQNIVPSNIIEVPELAGCIAFRANTKSMEPEILSNAILFARKVDDWIFQFEYGRAYWIVGKEGWNYLRVVKRHPESSSHLLLSSVNGNFEEFGIPKQDVQSIWLIKGHLATYI